MANKLPPVCHRMSGFLFTPMKPQTMLDVIGDPSKTTSVQTFRCLGADCALFVEDTDENGRPTGRGGMCGDKAQTIAMIRQATVMEMQLQRDMEEDAAQETVENSDQPRS